MKDVALFVKSHRPDLVLVHHLLDSVSRHNRDRIGVFISVPADDATPLTLDISGFLTPCDACVLHVP
jgi:hypothetical protein